MDKFEFSPDLSPEGNLELFLAHLDDVDKEMSELLRQNFNSLFPLPEPGQRRNTRRQAFNSKIALALDTEAPTEEPSE
jgi:hypothetical protein